MSLRLLALAVYYFVAGTLARVLGRADHGTVALPAPAEAKPATLDEQRLLARFSGCVACGRCDTAFSAYERTARPEFNGPSELALGYSRDPSRYGKLQRYLKDLAKGDLLELERVCPARIPFRELVEVMQRRSDAMAKDEPAPLPRPRHHPG